MHKYLLQLREAAACNSSIFAAATVLEVVTVKEAETAATNDKLNTLAEEFFLL